MCRCKLWFVFLLWLTPCSYNKADSGEQLVKTVRKETDFTPVCGNATQNVIVFVTCRIRLMRNSEEECNLTYHRMKGFSQGCDSRFSLISVNQTLYLQLNNLTSRNSGNYTCQCSKRLGTFILQLNITVEDDEDTSRSSEEPVPTSVIAYIGVPVLIIIVLLGVIAGFICRNKGYRRRRHEVIVTAQTNTEVEDIEPYSIFRENALYLTSITHTSRSTNNLIGVGMDNRSLGIPL